MTDYTDLQEAAEYAAQDTIKFADEDEEMRALQQFHEEVDPETVLALIAENESARKHWQNESNNVQVLVAEVARLNAENEALRKLKLPDYLHLSDQMRERGEHAELRAREDGCASVNVLRAVFFEAATNVWLHDQHEAIDAAMSKAVQS